MECSPTRFTRDVGIMTLTFFGNLRPYPVIVHLISQCVYLIRADLWRTFIRIIQLSGAVRSTRSACHPRYRPHISVLS